MEKLLEKFKPEIAIFGGSGFQNLIELENKEIISYKDAGFQYNELKGHNRQFVFGEYKGKKVVVLSRFHYYESGSTENLFSLFEMLSKLGVKTVISTTAVGGINPKLKAGDIVLIKDHINLTGTNPLIAKQPVKFVDLTNAYDRDLRKVIIKISKSLKIKLYEGVHLQSCGPTYETPAEIKFYESIGADTVSMSMVFDNICANYFGMKFVGFAGVTNKASNENSQPLSHEEVLVESQKICEKLRKIVENFLINL